MHKLRNTLHISLLEWLYERYKDTKRISKREMRIILSRNGWDKHKTIKEIEDDMWWYRFCKD